MAGRTTDDDRRWLELLLDVALISSSTDFIGDALTSAIARVCEHNGWYAGHARAEGIETGWWWSEPGDPPDEGARRLAEHWAEQVVSAGDTQFITDFSTLVDGDSPAQELPADAPETGGAIATPLRAAGRVVGAMVFLSRNPLISEGDDDYLKSLLRVIDGVGTHMGRAIERWNLVRRVVDEGEREREALGRDVHDGLAQQLVGINLLARNLRRRLEGSSGSDASDESERWDLLIDSLSGALDQARALARGLSSDRLTDASDHLVVQLEELAQVTRKGHQIDCSVQTEGSIRLEDELARTQLVRIAREAVYNALRHAEPSRIDLRVTNGDEQMTLEIHDDGEGFSGDVERVSGMGIMGMRYRAGIIGAALEIESSPSDGTVVRCTIRRP